MFRKNELRSTQTAALERRNFVTLRMRDNGSTLDFAAKAADVPMRRTQIPEHSRKARGIDG